MSEELDQSVLADLTNMDLSNVDTSRPLLGPCAVECVVSEIKIKESKKGGHYLEIQLKTLEEAPKFDSDDEEIQAGYVLFTNLSLTKTEKYDPLPNIARFQEATLGQKGPFGDVSDYVGQECSVKVKVRQSDEYGPQNDVAFIKKA